MLFIEENPQRKLQIEMQLWNTFLSDKKGLFTKENRQLALLVSTRTFEFPTRTFRSTRNSHNKCNSQLVTHTISATRNSQNISNSHLQLATRTLPYHHFESLFTKLFLSFGRNIFSQGQLIALVNNFACSTGNGEHNYVPKQAICRFTM